MAGKQRIVAEEGRVQEFSVSRQGDAKAKRDRTRQGAERDATRNLAGRNEEQKDASRNLARCGVPGATRRRNEFLPTARTPHAGTSPQSSGMPDLNDLEEGHVDVPHELRSTKLAKAFVRTARRVQSSRSPRRLLRQRKNAAAMASPHAASDARPLVDEAWRAANADLWDQLWEKCPKECSNTRRRLSEKLKRRCRKVSLHVFADSLSRSENDDLVDRRLIALMLEP